jgi:iron(III) transport system ATP-binding protein
MIAGFESPDEGEIYLGGEPINALTPNKRDTAMVFQSYALLPHYNIFDYVAYGLKLRKMDKAVIKEKVTGILKLVGLEGMEARMTNQLSGGQQQRVAIARAIVGNPKLLLADEPTGALDTASGVQIMDIFRRLSQRGITIIMITHELGIAQCADKIYHILDGRLHTNGVPQYTPKEEAHEEA